MYGDKYLCINSMLQIMKLFEKSDNSVKVILSDSESRYVPEAALAQVSHFFESAISFKQNVQSNDNLIDSGGHSQDVALTPVVIDLRDILPTPSDVKAILELLVYAISTHFKIPNLENHQHGSAQISFGSLVRLMFLSDVLLLSDATKSYIEVNMSAKIDSRQERVVNFVEECLYSMKALRPCFDQIIGLASFDIKTRQTFCGICISITQTLVPVIWLTFSQEQGEFVNISALSKAMRHPPMPSTDFYRNERNPVLKKLGPAYKILAALSNPSK
jgi:hypothetical protein